MLDTFEFGKRLMDMGYTFFSGVPCSYLKPFINFAMSYGNYILATNEGDAVAICSGMYLGGKKGVLLIQNSGLNNALSPLTSLNLVFEIPILGFVSWRGQPGIQDQPQHKFMGRITPSVLDLLGVPWEFLSNDLDTALKQLERADENFSKGRSYFFIVQKGTFSDVDVGVSFKSLSKNVETVCKKGEDSLPLRLKALKIISKFKDDNTVLLATTGKAGRELYEIEDSKHNLYMVGSMGCLSSLALGLCIAKKNKRVIAIDGDGAFLMRMGAVATIGFYNPKNLLHILLDNSSHDSTGGQPTVSSTVDFVSIAKAVGYKYSYYAHNISEFEKYIEDWKEKGGLTFLYLRIKKGSKKDLGRPKISPPEVKKKLMEFLAGEK